MTNSNNNSDDISGLWGAAGLCAGGAAIVVGAAAYAYFSSNRRRLSPPPTRDLEGMTVCITGANVGIGRAVAEALGQRGARILLGCRNLDQAKDVCDKIGNHQCLAFALDLAQPASVASFAETIVQQTPLRSGGLHLLINNAGAMIRESDRRVHDDSEDSWDRTMAVNHLGWMQLTQHLLPVLQKTADTATTRPIRIVNVGSTLEKMAKLPTRVENPAAWDDWLKDSITATAGGTTPSYSPFQAYGNAKWAMTATTFYWAQQLAITTKPNNNESNQHNNNNNIQMILVSPGMVNTSLPRFMPLWKRVLSYPFRALLLKSPEEASETVLFAATSPTAESGKYYRAHKGITVQEISQDTDKCSETAKSQELGKHIYEASLRALERRSRNEAGRSSDNGR